MIHTNEIANCGGETERNFRFSDAATTIMVRFVSLPPMAIGIKKASARHYIRGHVKLRSSFRKIAIAVIPC